MTRLLKSLSHAFAVAAVGLLVAGAASANIIPVFSAGPNPSASGPNWSFNYDVSVTGDQKVVSGDFLTFYDIHGFVSGAAPAGWVVSSANTGVTAPGTLPTDNAAEPNVTFTYTGATLVGPQSLGVFSIISTEPLVQNTQFTAQGTRSTGPGANTKLGNIGQIEGPGPRGPVIPEPGALALLLPGLAPVGMFLRRRRSA